MRDGDVAPVRPDGGDAALEPAVHVDGLAGLAAGIAPAAEQQAAIGQHPEVNVQMTRFDARARVAPAVGIELGLGQRARDDDIRLVGQRPAEQGAVQMLRHEPVAGDDHPLRAQRACGCLENVLPGVLAPGIDAGARMQDRAAPLGGARQAEHEAHGMQSESRHELRSAELLG